MKNLKKLDSGKADFTSATFQAQNQTLFSKIKKFVDKQYEVVEKMKEDSYYTSNLHGLKMKKNAENLLKCYEQLFHFEPRNKEQLNQLKWLFNDGMLRTDEEIADREVELEERDYANGKYYVDCFRERGRSANFTDITLRLVFILFPIIPFICAFSLWTDFGFEEFSMSYTLFCIPSFLIHFAIWGGLSSLDSAVSDSRLATYAAKAGKKAKFPIQSVASFASYAIFLKSLGKICKTKK